MHPYTPQPSNMHAELRARYKARRIVRYTLFLALLALSPVILPFLVAHALLLIK